MTTKFSNLFVTGGAGYCGSLLVPQLLQRGYKVTVYDTCSFGDDFLPKDNPNLQRHPRRHPRHGQARRGGRGHDAFVSLACISNDASFELDENLSTSINLDAFEPMVRRRQEGRRQALRLRFVELGLRRVRPAERHRGPSAGAADALQQVQRHVRAAAVKHTDDELRRRDLPAGDGLRLRAASAARSVSVNILTNHAVNNNKITVFGGAQLRPNLHVQDYCDAVEVLLTRRTRRSQNEIFNVGYQNMSIMDIAMLVKRVGRAGISGEGRDRYRHDAERRPPLLPHQFGQD